MKKGGVLSVFIDIVLPLLKFECAPPYLFDGGFRNHCFFFFFSQRTHNYFGAIVFPVSPIEVRERSTAKKTKNGSEQSGRRTRNENRISIVLPTNYNPFPGARGRTSPRDFTASTTIRTVIGLRAFEQDRTEIISSGTIIEARGRPNVRKWFRTSNRCMRRVYCQFSVDETVSFNYVFFYNFCFIIWFRSAVPAVATFGVTRLMQHQ